VSLRDAIYDAILKTIGWLWLIGCVVTWLLAEGHMLFPPKPSQIKIKRTWFVARYDKWMGLYEVYGTKDADYSDKRAYWLPLPCVGMKLEYAKSDRKESQ